MSSTRRLAVAWIGLALVLGAALAVGAHRPGPAQTPAQRAASIDAALRCPSCEGISVAQSSASTAVAIRHLVATRVAEDQSTAQIEDFLVSRYGEGILLSPPGAGGTALVWVLPVAGAAAALVVLATFFWRRRRVVAGPVADEDRRLVADALSGPVA